MHRGHPVAMIASREDWRAGARSARASDSQQVRLQGLTHLTRLISPQHLRFVLAVSVGLLSAGCLTHDRVKPRDDGPGTARGLHDRLMEAKLASGMARQQVLDVLGLLLTSGDVAVPISNARRTSIGGGEHWETLYSLPGGDVLSLIEDGDGVVLLVSTLRGSEAHEMVLAPPPPRALLDSVPYRWDKLLSVRKRSEILPSLGLSKYRSYFDLTCSEHLYLNGTVHELLAHYEVPGYRLSIVEQRDGLLVVAFCSPERTALWATRTSNASEPIPESRHTGVKKE